MYIQGSLLESYRRGKTTPKETERVEKALETDKKMRRHWQILMQSEQWFRNLLMSGAETNGRGKI